jgi:hypothetical protein
VTLCDQTKHGANIDSVLIPEIIEALMALDAIGASLFQSHE